MLRRLIKRVKAIPNIGKEPYLSFYNILGFYPDRIDLYKEAMTHRSSSIRSKKGKWVNNERLEFLGDAILDAIVADILYKKFENKKEGFLTSTRSRIVQRDTLNKIAVELGLDKMIVSSTRNLAHNTNIYGDALEALIGAIYLDRGYAYCEQFIHKRVIYPYVDIERLEGKVISYKSLFIEYCQKNKQDFRFEVFEDEGKELNTYFAVRLHLDDEVVARARGTSKKKAEEQAAKRAYFKYQQDMEALRDTQTLP